MDKVFLDFLVETNDHMPEQGKFYAPACDTSFFSWQIAAIVISGGTCFFKLDKTSQQILDSVCIHEYGGSIAAPPFYISAGYYEAFPFLVSKIKDYKTNKNNLEKNNFYRYKSGKTILIIDPPCSNTFTNGLGLLFDTNMLVEDVIWIGKY